MPAPTLSRPRSVRVAAGLLLVAALIALVSRLDLRPNLRHLQVALLSGPPEGNYHAIAGTISAAAAKKGGRVDNVTSAGSIANVARLAAAAGTCEVQAALVQGGLDVPDEPKLELLGRLWKAESVFF